MVVRNGAATSPFRALAKELATGQRDESWLTRRLDFVDARLDLSDHRLLGIIKLYLAGGEELTAEQRERIERTMLGFKYHWDEPGVDSMCSWSETHQLLFAVCEYLAGDALAERIFRNDGRSGLDKKLGAEKRLRAWLDDRFHFGFSEWLSNTYSELNIIGLSVLIDHCDDADLVARASMVLDLLFFDLAAHGFTGRLITSSGRAYARQKAHPTRAEITPLIAAAFGIGPLFDAEQLNAPFIGRDLYQVPHTLREIAWSTGGHVVRSSHGLELSELDAELSRRPGLSIADRRDAELSWLWGMEAFTTTRGMGASLAEFQRTTVGQNRFLAPLAKLGRIKGRRMAAAAVRAVNPITQGAALERANVLTYRTPHFCLSSAQRYHPGEFGDQQHIWNAALPGDISVFATHPGATTLGSEARPATPSAWVGNGINPDVAQQSNVLLAMYDTTVVRRGYLEGFRHELSHLYFPFSRFDETSLGRTWLAGRRGDSFIGIVSLEPMEMVSEVEVVQRGPLTGWAVIVADRSEFRSLTHLVDEMRTHPLRLRGSTLIWQTPEHRYSLTYRGPFVVDGQRVSSDFPRYDSEWATIARRSDTVTIRGSQHTLRLNWDTGVREETLAAERET